jgi:hypothetical protein
MIEHVNLFQDLQNQERLANNEEHEAEQKAKDEKWEKQITMYLDKGVKKGNKRFQSIECILTHMF